MTTWETYQGIEVLDSQPEPPCRHPRWGNERLTKLKGATLLALAGDIFLVVCDECGYNGVTASDQFVKPEGELKSILQQSNSVSAHINGMHHPGKDSRRTSLYTDDQIKVAIKIFLKWKNTHIRGWTQRAVDELETLGFKPFSSPTWNTDQLSSLVRKHMAEDKFKNVKAAPMNDEDRAAIAGMVRDAASRSKTGVGASARITEKKPAAPHKHTPVDFSAIIASKEAAKQQQQQQQKEEDIVPAGSNPTLNFIGPGSKVAPEPTPVRELPVDVNAVREPLDAPVVRRGRGRPPGSGKVEESPFKHLADLDDGTPMFTYNGVLMVGKPVRGVEV